MINNVRNIRRALQCSTRIQTLRVDIISRNLSSKVDGEIIDATNFHSHFKASGRPHPLGVKTTIGAVAQLGDHTGLQQNHIWTLEELETKMKEHPRHQPKTISDHVMNKLVTIITIFSFFSCNNTINSFLSSRCTGSIIPSTLLQAIMPRIHR